MPATSAFVKLALACALLHSASAVQLILKDSCGGSLTWVGKANGWTGDLSKGAGTYTIPDSMTGGKVWAYLPGQTNAAADGQGCTIVEPNYGGNTVSIATSRAGGWNGNIKLTVMLANGKSQSSQCDNSGNAATDNCYVNLGNTQETVVNNKPNNCPSLNFDTNSGQCNLPSFIPADSPLQSVTIEYTGCKTGVTSLTNYVRPARLIRRWVD